MSAESQATILQEFARGWRPLLAGLLGIASSVLVVHAYSFGVLMPSLAAEFGGSKTQWSTPITVSLIISVITAPIAGRVVDRFGPARIAVPSLLACSLLFMSASRFIDGFVALLGFTVAMALVGSGTHNSTYLYSLGGFFSRSRGLAIGIVMSGTGLCGTIIPRLVEAAVSEGGWRAGYARIALVLLIAAVVQLVLLWNLRPPAAKPSEDHSPAPLPRWGVTTAEALHTSAFRKAAVVVFVFALATTGQMPHAFSIATGQGFDAVHAAKIASIIGIAVVVGRLGAGFLLDHLFVAYVGVIFLAVAAAGLLLMAFGGPSWLAAGIFLLGLGLGAEVDLAGYIVGRYFGDRHYASIFGWLIAAYSTGAMLSPLVAGAFRDLSGSYSLGLTVAAGILVLVAPVIMSMPRYPDRKHVPA